MMGILMKIIELQHFAILDQLLINDPSVAFEAINMAISEMHLQWENIPYEHRSERYVHYLTSYLKLLEKNG